MSLTVRELFGGAITASLPLNLVDASSFRQVPDNQEVFISPSTNVSFIIEVLQRVDSNDPDTAVRFHFDSIAHDNDAESSSVESVDVPDEVQQTTIEGDTPVPIILEGLQGIAKFNSQVTDKVRIFVALYRIPSKGVDLVLSANFPLETESGPSVPEANIGTARQLFVAAAKSLKIIDFMLFG